MTESPAYFRQAWQHASYGLIVLNFDTPVNLTTNALTDLKFEQLKDTASKVTIIGYASSTPFFGNRGDLFFSQCKYDDETDCIEYISPRDGELQIPIDASNIPSLALQVRKEKLCWDYINAEWNACPKPKFVAPFKITIDPGHGGSDPGAVAQGYQEKALTMDVSARLRDLLKASPSLWSIQMTRSSDVDVSLTARTNMANAWPADRFVSIHINSFTSSSAQGTETYSYSSSGTAANLRNVIQSEMIAAWGLVNRGSKTGNFHVLRETTMPATLSELGFITSPVDINKLASATERQKAAQAHLNALKKHFGVFSEEDEE